MSEGALIPPERIRLVFELERADNSRLYDDLIQFKKGSKRVNRLRTLAQEGLLAQYWSPIAAAHMVAIKSEAIPSNVGAASITNQVFDEPLVERMDLVRTRCGRPIDFYLLGTTCSFSRPRACVVPERAARCRSGLCGTGIQGERSNPHRRKIRSGLSHCKFIVA